MKPLLAVKVSTVTLCICILKNFADGIGFYSGSLYPNPYTPYAPPAYGRYGGYGGYGGYSGYGYYPPAYGYAPPVYGYPHSMYSGYLPPGYNANPPQTVSGFVQQLGNERNPNRVVGGFVQQDGTQGYFSNTGPRPIPLNAVNRDVLNALFPGLVQVTTIPPPTTTAPPPPQGALGSVVNGLVQDLLGPHGLLGNAIGPTNDADGKSQGLLGNLLGPDGLVGKLLG